MWENIASFVLRNRWPLIGGLIVITAFMAYQASEVEMAYDNPKFIPDDDPDYANYLQFKQLFGDDGSVMVIGVESPEIHSLKFFQEWYDLTVDLKKKDGVKQVLSLANLPHLVKVDEEVIFDEDTFQNTVFHAEPVVQKRPSTQTEVDTLFQKLYDLKFYEGLVFTDNPDFTLMAITLEKDILDTKRRIAYVSQLVEDVRQRCSEHDVEPRFSGLPYIRTEYSKKVKAEIVQFTLISLLITSLILLLFFRSFYTLLFSMLVVVVGVIWCMGILVLLGFKITMFVGLLPPLIVVIGIANCIYLLNKYHDEFKTHRNKIKSLKRVISKVGLAVFFTNLTTGIGFGVFVLTGSTVLQEFGLTAFFSIMSVFIISVLLIPVIFSFLPTPKTKHTRHLDNRYLQSVIEGLAKSIDNRRKRIYWITGSVVVLAIVGMTQIKTIGFMVDDISKSDPLYKDLKFFEKHIHGIMPFEIVVDSKMEDGIKDVSTLQKIDLLERELEKYPEFSKPMSVAQAMKFLNQSFYDGNPKRYLVPSVLNIGQIMSMIPTEETNAKMLHSMVDSVYQKARISVQMADVGSVEIKRIREQVDSNITEIFPSDQYDVDITGTSVIFLKGNDYLIQNLLISLVVAFFIISMIMASIFKSLRMIIISLVPNMIPLLITAGIMGYFGVSFKPSTVLVFSVAFGIAVDFTIHFLSKYKLELNQNGHHIEGAVSKALRETGVSMIYTSVILFFGFIIFTFSRFGGTIALGAFTSITLVVALLSNLLLLPSLLMSYDAVKSKKKS
jgi:hypothetical protein